jgi:hypothetical protein
VVADTTLTFEDLDGNGVDDDCQDAVVPDAEAAAAALLATDLDGDGKVSVSEAAQSGWTGGKNCNHGGYVRGVAKPAETPAEEPIETDAPTECATEETPTVVPAVEQEPVDPAPNAHGKAVSEVAKSDAVGGKNCNHGGAVSEAAKKDHDAAKAERDAAKIERAAQRDARKDAEKTKQHGKNNGG